MNCARTLLCTTIALALNWASPLGAQRPRIELIVAATTDVHGRLRGWDYFAGVADSVRGLARAATIVDSLREANPGRVVLVDAGDLLQGSPLTYVAARVDSLMPHPVIAAMNVMRYDAAAIGNHEFNYGLRTLARAVAQARFPFLAANAYSPSGTRAYASHTLIERRGVKIGIVGATTPGAVIWDRDHLAGRLLLRDIVPDVRRAVAEVRARGASVVVVTMHSGLSEAASYDTTLTGVPSENVGARVAREVSGIDVLVIGHSHRELADSTIGTTLVMQAKNWATSVAVANLVVERAGNRWRVARKRGTLVQAAGRREHPAVIHATERAHNATLSYVNRVIGTTPVAWRADSARVVDTPLIDFLLEVQRRATGADLAATAAFDIGASLDAGPITVAEIARLYPYENTLRAVKITGGQLRAFLEHSARYYRTFQPGAEAPVIDVSVPGYNFDIIAGAEYTLDLTRPLGARVSALSVKGKEVAPNDTFTLALNNYRQTGGGGFAMLRGAPVVFDGQVEIRQLLIDEARRRGTLRHEDYATRNWRLVPDEAVRAAYGAMNRGAYDGGPTTEVRRPRSGSGRRIRIIAINDFHGGLEPRTDSGGTARGGAVALASEIANARAECMAPSCTSILLDGGDQFQGTPGSNLAFGRPVVTLFNRLGLAASALGNHDLDWGRDTLRARMREARYPVLGANVRDMDGRDVPWIPDDTLIGDIGVIGVASVATPRLTMAKHVAGLRFVDPAPVIDARAKALRARGAKAIVVVAHAGGFCDRGETRTCTGEIIDLANQLTEKVDAIVSGHTHSAVTTIVNGTAVVQARSRGSAIGIVDLWPEDPAAIPAVTLRDVLPATRAHVPWADSLVRRAAAAVSDRMARPVARIAERMAPGMTGSLGPLIADAQRAVGGGDLAVVNTGGVRAALPAGLATYGSIYETQPLGNRLVRITVAGRDLRKYLERLLGRETPAFYVSGVSLTFDPARPSGSRLVRAVFADGRLLDDARIYRIVMSDFLATGGDGLGLSSAGERTEELDIVDVDALETYLMAQPSPVRPPSMNRITRVMP